MANSKDHGAPPQKPAVRETPDFKGLLRCLIWLAERESAANSAYPLDLLTVSKNSILLGPTAGPTMRQQLRKPAGRVTGSLFCRIRRASFPQPPPVAVQRRSKRKLAYPQLPLVCGGTPFIICSRGGALHGKPPWRRKLVSHLRYLSKGKPSDEKARGFKPILVYCVGLPDGCNSGIGPK
jgi:hypothetical protein